MLQASDKPGGEITGIVILSGLLTVTFLNMIVIPVLLGRWGVGKIDRIRIAEIE